jgi:hypothetical protein
MAVPPTPVDSVSQQLDDIEGVDGAFTAAPVEKVTEIYRLDPKTKIPVSKHEGPLWKSRKSAGDKAMRDVREGWEEAEYYYNNAQQNHRKETGGNRAGNRNAGKDRRDQFSMTENIVYATVNAVIPNIYAKNPSIEVTMTDSQLEPFGVVLEHLANKLAAMRNAPGINLKAKARKSIVRCEITNEAWVMIGYNMRDQGQDQARVDIQKLGAELAKAKDRKTIERIEGELLALEETIDFLDPPGPFVRSFRGDQVRIDPGNTEDDTSDCNWMMVQVMFPTVYLNARYRQKGKDGNYVSAYKATHVVDASTSTGAESVQQQIDNFKLFDVDAASSPNSYGYSDRNAFERGQMTECWYVFDKVKRRFMLFAENDWSWPIWVFDDPYHFPDFFPLEKLQYHTDPRQTRVRGEVSHYLDQQDEINTIVDEGNRARISLRDNTLFDSNVLTTKDVEDIVLNSNKKMKGIKVPEGRKLEELIMGPPMPTLEYQFLWDKSSAKQAIGMIAGIQDAMRGEQYKTNTTNEAIEQYNSISSTRLDEKRDAIEDFIGGIMAKVLFLCLQFMDAETVATLVGTQYQEGISLWRNMTPDEIRKLVQCSIEGGSTLKPTSAAKKAEALQIGQILGQFASQSPHVVLVVLKIMQRAFDSVNITDADWQMLTQGIQQQLMGPPPGAGAQPGGGQLPPEGEQIVGELVQQGMPEEVARAEVAKKLSGGGGAPNGAAGPPQ